MANLTQTAGNVVPASGASIEYGTAGETITAGMPVYRDASSGKYMKAANDTATKAAAVGVAVNGAALNQPITVQTKGGINLGATLAVGTTYCVSDTAGAICPDSDIGEAEFKTILGVATTTSNLALLINASGVAIPGA